MYQLFIGIPLQNITNHSKQLGSCCVRVVSGKNQGFGIVMARLVVLRRSFVLRVHLNTFALHSRHSLIAASCVLPPVLIILFANSQNQNSASSLCLVRL